MGAVASIIGLLSSWFQSAPEDEGSSPENQEQPNPVTGLTPGQVKVVQRTFGLVRPNLKAFGVDALMELFSAHPEYQKLFKSFATVPLNELPEDKKFVALATVLANSFQKIVDSLDDTDSLVELLFKVGCDHGHRKIEPKAFEDLRNGIIALLKKKFGNEFTPFDEESWCKTLDVANSVIFKGLAQGKLEAALRPSS